MDTCGDMFWGTAGGEARGWEGALLPFIGTHSPVGKKVNNEYIAKYSISGHCRKIRFRRQMNTKFSVRI